EHGLEDVLVEPKVNLGIPGGRNAGLLKANAEYILFLDDDAKLADENILRNAIRYMNSDTDLAVLALHIFDEEKKVNRRHHPRLRLRPETPGYVTSFPGGASFVRKTALKEIGSFCKDFFYGLEETDLAWRLYDSGWKVKYCPDLKVFHPKTTPQRHKSFYFNTARNRVWLSYRQLPLILSFLYVSIWLGISIGRNIFRLDACKAIVLGTIDGVRSKRTDRSPISWRTVIELSRLGRPPII
ncbi:MAG: glycosyl transferase, partial [Verrucomicrobiaceae bacterium]|nr:glycosyl transferase [Verrucomicrobiaceae bacterium]